MKKLITGAPVALAAILLLSACGKHDADNSAAPSEQTLNDAAPAEGDASGNVVVPEEGGFENGAADLGNSGDDLTGNGSASIANGL
jgi:major membrane immunogen (membrane-anchored lipoprotein)